MSIKWKQLAQVVLTATPAAEYTAPTNTTATVHAAQAWNPTASPVVVDVYIVPSGGSAADATHVDRVQVPATSAAPVYGLLNQKLGAGMAIYAAGLGVTLTVAGAESA
jgi:microcystin degradation protein MlrC